MNMLNGIKQANDLESVFWVTEKTIFLCRCDELMALMP